MTEAMTHNNKICVITGAGSGIGRALARALGKKGATVVVSDINEQSAGETAQMVNNDGIGKAIASQLDVTQADAVRDLLRSTAQEYGQLDLVVNNAGIAVASDARDLTLDHWRRVIDVNLMGVIYGADAAYKIMAEQGHGHIVNISSLSGLIPFPTNIPYGTTKHAVVGLSLGMRAEGEALGVRVSAVCPGFIESNIYSASEAINVPGEALSENLPFKKVPADVAAERILAGVAANKDIIVFPGYAKFIWWLFRISRRLVAGPGREMIRDFRKLRQAPD